MVPVKEHGEWLSEIGLQVVNRLEDVCLVDHCRDCVHTVILAGVDKVLVLRAVEHGVLELLSFVVVDKDVPHNRVEPPFHVGAFLEVVLVPQGLHHGILHQVVCIRAVARETQSKSPEEVGLTDEKLVEFECAHDRFV